MQKIFNYYYIVIIAIIIKSFTGKYLSDQAIVQMSRVFANGLGDRCSILGWVIPKTKKIVLDAALLSTQ